MNSVSPFFKGSFYSYINLLWGYYVIFVHIVRIRWGGLDGDTNHINVIHTSYHIQPYTICIWDLSKSYNVSRCKFRRDSDRNLSIPAGNCPFRSVSRIFRAVIIGEEDSDRLSRYLTVFKVSPRNYIAPWTGQPWNSHLEWSSTVSKKKQVSTSYRYTVLHLPSLGCL